MRPNDDFQNTARLTSGSGQPASDVAAHLVLTDTDIQGKYGFRDVPANLETINTAQSLGADEHSVLELMSSDGSVISRLSKPDGHEFLYNSLLPAKDWMNAYYAGDYDDEVNRQEVSADDIRAMRKTDKVHRYCARFLKPGARVLDIGCGFGDQLSFFKAAGFQTRGLDIGEKRVKVACEAYGIDAREIDIEALDQYPKLLGEDRFDLIYLNQVLEHLRHPLELMETLRGYLADDGMLFIAVPHVRLEGLFLNLLNTVHTHSFTAPGLRSFMAGAGFELVHDAHVIGYNTMLFKPATPNKQPAPTGEIDAQIERLFCYEPWSKNGSGALVQTSKVVGDMTARYQTLTAPPDKGEALRIASDFPRPRMLFK